MLDSEKVPTNTNVPTKVEDNGSFEVANHLHGYFVGGFSPLLVVGMSRDVEVDSGTVYDWHTMHLPSAAICSFISRATLGNPVCPE